MDIWLQRISLFWAEGILGCKSGHREASTEVTLVTWRGCCGWRGAGPRGEAGVRCLACAGGHVHPEWADGTDLANRGEGRLGTVVDATVAVEMGTPRLGEMWKAVQALCCCCCPVAGGRVGTGSQVSSRWWAGGWGLSPMSASPSQHPPLFLASLPAVINKYKRRRFQKTKNLLTGETEADPEMIKVNTNRAIGSWGRRPDPGSQLSRPPRGVISCTTTEPLGEPLCLRASVSLTRSRVRM